MKKISFTSVKEKEVKAEGAYRAFIRWLITEEEGAPNFAMRVFRVEPGGYTPYHKHPWEHEVFVLKGKGVLKFEDKEYPLEEGDFVFIEPEKKHQFKNAGQKDFYFICVIPHKPKTS